MYNKLITSYSEVLSLDEETVRAIFSSCIDSLYSGDDEAFLDDLFMGFVVTDMGKTNAVIFFDYMASMIMA